MKRNWLKVNALIIACVFALSTQVFAADQDRAKAKDQDQTYDQIKDQKKDQKKDGTCLLEDYLY